MKITTQAIPPELADLYADLISTTAAGPDAGTRARTRRAARQSHKRQPPNAQALAIARIVMALARLAGRAGNDAAARAWRHARAAALYTGTIESAYWQPAAVVATAILTSIPAVEPDPSPPPYAYRDTEDLPTLSTWTAGSADTGAPRYAGSSDGAYFEDTAWTWRRTTWRLLAPITDPGAAAVFAMLDGTIQIDASRRGSRPMCSLLARLALSAADAAATTDTAPPLIRATQHYWRYAPPLGAAPYYHVTLPRRVLQPLYQGRSPGSGDTVTCAMSVQPMFGRGQNNNAAVATSWDGTETLYEPPPCFHDAAAATLTLRAGAARIVASVTATSGATLSDAILAACAYSCEGTAPWRAAKPLSAGVVSTDPTTWLALAGASPPAIGLGILDTTAATTATGNQGADRDRFTLTADALTFLAQPDRADPADADADGIYTTCVLVADAAGDLAYADLLVTPLYAYALTATTVTDTRAYDVTIIVYTTDGIGGLTQPQTNLGHYTGDTATTLPPLLFAQIATNAETYRQAHEDGLHHSGATGWTVTKAIHIAAAVEPNGIASHRALASYTFTTYTATGAWWAESNVAIWGGFTVSETGSPAGTSYLLDPLTDTDAAPAYSIATAGSTTTAHYTLLTSAPIWPLTSP